MLQYKWILSYDSTSVEVHPIYKDDLSLDYQQEQGKMFFRGKLSGKISFVGADADRIINAPFYTEFNVTILSKAVTATTWNNYYQCRFFKTDCTINEEDRKVEVQPSVVDVYNDILNGLEKEYNLLEMPLYIQRIIAQKRPMWQIYVEGDDVVSCVSGANSFETDRINDDRTPQSCHFGKFNDQWKIYLNTNIDGLKEPFVGIFSGLDQRQVEYKDKFYNSENIYYLEYFCYVAQGVSDEYYANGLRVKRIYDDELIYNFGQRFTDTQGGFGVIPDSFNFLPLDTSLANIAATKQNINIYGRIVCDVERFEAPMGTYVYTYAISNNDIVNNNRNYRYCREWATLYVRQSNRLSNTPTKWGRADGGKYFLPPDDASAWLPIGQSTWGNTSIWLELSDIQTYDPIASKQYAIKDTYSLASVINALLSKIAPSVTFYETPQSSIFFYNDTIESGVASVLNDTRLFISPKSNILLGEYQEPAQKAPITLKTVFDMLQNVYGCYWYVKSDNTLCIEHVSWFKNGGSYSDNPTIGYDLTALENLPNEKKWAFGTSQYQYDKIDMPARYQYKWMDDVTEMFAGKPINILSKFVTENKVEEVTIAEFTSDIDLMLLAPEKFSKDGFALLQATRSGNTFYLALRRYYDGVYPHTLQNYMAAMVFLQPNFLTYDMPSWAIEVDETATRAAGIQRAKKQTLTFPIGDTDPDLSHLVKTYIGNGQFDKVSINLSSRSAKTTLKYNTYDE